MKKHFLGVAAIIISSPLLAQDSVRTKQLDEVVVTANKTPQKQSTTGKVVTVITKEQIEKSSGRTLGQLLNEQAGLIINGALNNLGTNQSMYVRGGSSGRTLVLLDGIPMYDPSLINNEFDLNLLSINDVERVEICRGAQSTLYGSDAIAGVINIITIKKDVNKPLNVKATLSGGAYNTFRGNVQVYGKSGKLTYTTRYAKLTTKGFSAAYDSSGKKDFEKDGYNGDVANAVLQYQATPALSVRSFIQYSRYKTDIDATTFTDEKDYTIKNKNVVAGTGIHYQKNNVNLTANYQYSDITRNYYNDSIDRPTFSKFATDDYFGKAQFIEAYTSIGLGSGFTILQGADYRFSTMNNKYLSLSSFGPFTTQFKDTSHSQASLYGSLMYNSANEKLNVELGGRMNVHSRYGSNGTYTFNPSYSFNKHFRVFGSIASAFKAPSLYQLYSFSYGKPDLKPERSTNYELGVQQAHGKITNRVVFFHRIIKDGIDFNSFTNKYFNFNKQTVKGIEWESSVQPVQHLTVAFNYTYIKPEEQSQSRVTFKDTTYDQLLRRPQHSFNITAGYQLNALYVSVSGKYVSSRYDVGGYKVNDVKLDGYFLLGAYAEYKLKKYLKFFADAQNITDKKFFDVRGYNSIPFIINGGVTFQL